MFRLLHYGHIYVHVVVSILTTVFFVQVFDGNSTSSPLLATLCGNIKHSPIRSSGNELFILFESDSTIEASGYSLKWQITHSTCTYWDMFVGIDMWPLPLGVSWLSLLVGDWGVTRKVNNSLHTFIYQKWNIIFLISFGKNICIRQY